MIDLATLARTYDAVFEACQPEPVCIDEWDGDENVAADLRERVRDAAAERRQL